MPARNSEIRSYLLRFAAKKGILVQEYLSEWRDGPAIFYCHIQDGKDPKRTATALSKEGFDNALCMAFLSFFEAECDFILDDGE
jgi:hypothetical protein